MPRNCTTARPHNRENRMAQNLLKTLKNHGRTR